MTKPTAAANAAGLRQDSALVSALDHLSLTKDLVEVGIMASHALSDALERNALCSLGFHIKDRLNGLSEILKQAGAEVRS